MTAHHVAPQHIVIPEALADAPTKWSFLLEISLLTAILVIVSVILFTRDIVINGEGYLDAIIGKSTDDRAWYQPCRVARTARCRLTTLSDTV